MKVFITGGSGFAGYHIIKELLKAGHTVTAAIHRNQLHPDISNQVHSVQTTLDDWENLAGHLAGYDAVIHSAGMISFRKKDKAAIFRTNAEGTKNLVFAAKQAGIKRFIHIGSVASVGASSEPENYHPEIPYNLKSLRVNYSISKYHADQEIRRATIEGMETVLLSPGNIIGPEDFRFQNLNYFRMAAANWKIVPDGGISLVDVRDVAFAAVVSLTAPVSGRQFILAAKTGTYGDFIDWVAGKRNRYKLPRLIYYGLGYGSELFTTLTGFRLPFTIEKSRLGGYYFWFDGRDAENYLQFKYRTMEESIADSVTWYRQQGVLK